MSFGILVVVGDGMKRMAEDLDAMMCENSDELKLGTRYDGGDGVEEGCIDFK